MTDDNNKPKNPLRRTVIRSLLTVGAGSALGAAGGKVMDDADQRPVFQEITDDASLLAFGDTLVAMESDKTMTNARALALFDAKEKAIMDTNNAELSTARKRRANDAMRKGTVVGTGLAVMGLAMQEGRKAAKHGLDDGVEEFRPSPEEIAAKASRRKFIYNVVGGAGLGTAIAAGTTVYGEEKAFKEEFSESYSHQAARVTLEALEKDKSIPLPDAFALFKDNLEKFRSDRDNFKEDATQNVLGQAAEGALTGGALMVAGQILVGGPQESHTKKIKPKTKEPDDKGGGPSL